MTCPFSNHAYLSALLISNVASMQRYHERFQSSIELRRTKTRTPAFRFAAKYKSLIEILSNVEVQFDPRGEERQILINA